MFRQTARAARRRRGARACGFSAGVAILVLGVGAAYACDLCAIYTTTEGREEETGPYLAVGEQYTYFATEKLNGTTLANPYGERLRSSITQLIAGYKVHPRVGLQINFPIIDRTFRRVESGGVVDGNATGIGDMSVIASVRPFSWVNTIGVGHLILFGGLKFPTGDPALLSEELDPPPCIPFPDPRVCNPRLSLRAGVEPHHGGGGPPSGIHGHDLALGSGSVDGIVGAQIFATWRRVFASAGVQYVARTVGAFGYQYANDLLFETGPGAYLLLGDDLFGSPYTFGAQVVFSGETKGTDTLQDLSEPDTGITALYLGPAFRFTWGVHLAAEIGADLPVLQNTTQLQIVPDYRLRGGISWRF